MSGSLYADFGGMAASRSALTAVGADLTATVKPVQSAADASMSAAGEFHADLADGAATFALSWSSALTFFAESTHVLAANLGTATVALTGLDARLAQAAGHVPHATGRMPPS